TIRRTKDEEGRRRSRLAESSAFFVPCPSPPVGKEETAMTRALWTLVLAGLTLTAGIGRAETPKVAKDPPRTLLLMAGIDKHATLLLGSSKGSERATKGNLLKRLKAVAAEAREGDTVVLGFFGHGGPLGETGGRCYFLADSTFAGRAKDALTPDEVEAVLKG